MTFEIRVNFILLPTTVSHIALRNARVAISNGICRYLFDIGNYRRVMMSLREQCIDSRRQFAMTSWRQYNVTMLTADGRSLFCNYCPI